MTAAAPVADAAAPATVQVRWLVRLAVIRDLQFGESKHTALGWEVVRTLCTPGRRRIVVHESAKIFGRGAAELAKAHAYARREAETFYDVRPREGVDWASRIRRSFGRRGGVR